MLKKLLLFVFLISAFLGVGIALHLRLEACDGRVPIPSIILGPYYAIINGTDKVYLGQAHDLNHEGFWNTNTKLVFLGPTGAAFRIRYREEDGSAVTCRLFIPRPPAGAAPAYLSFKTRDPEKMEPLLFRPEDLSGTWANSTYRVYSQNLPVHREPQRPFVDQIRAIISPVFIVPWDLDKPGYTPPQAVEQIVYAYASESDAYAAFLNDSRTDDIRPISDYQALLENHFAHCYLLEAGYYCLFRAQYRNYLVYIRAPIDGENISSQDWLEFVRVVQERLLKVDE